MALITTFNRVNKDRTQVHRTTVECGWTTFERDGRVYLQLETYGSDERKIPGKISQSLQLDADTAAELAGIIRQAFAGR
jgi:hypothetical protein